MSAAKPIPAVLRQLVMLRRRAQLSQRALARRMGTAQSAISEMETGVNSPTLATLERYAEIVGMEVVLTPAIGPRPAEQS